MDHQHTQQSSSEQPYPKQDFWDELYNSKDALWSGRPNGALVTEAGGLVPGRALDVGAGEGGDAIWLAGNGWTVTAADISPVALARAQAHAKEAGEQIASAIEWKQTDLVVDPPESGAYDLVSAFYFQMLPEPRTTIMRNLTAAVAPHGTLLIVGHDMEGAVEHEHDPEMFFTVDDVTVLLDPAEWEVAVSEVRTRDHAGPGGHVADVVVRAVRRA